LNRIIFRIAEWFVANLYIFFVKIIFYDLIIIDDYPYYAGFCVLFGTIRHSVPTKMSSIYYFWAQQFHRLYSEVLKYYDVCKLRNSCLDFLNTNHLHLLCQKIYRKLKMYIIIYIYIYIFFPVNLLEIK